MSRFLEQTLEIQVELGEPVALLRLESLRFHLQRRGIYFLCEGVTSLAQFDAESRTVIYIGKAANETIFSRCRKHLTAMKRRGRDALPAGIRPGCRFRVYVSKPEFNLERVFLVPGFMDQRPAYEPACAEEYFLWKYAAKHGGPPVANTAHARSPM